MSQKRKRSDIDSSDEDEPTLGKQVLPVANLPANFNGVPEDGLQYLFTVRCVSLSTLTYLYWLTFNQTGGTHDSCHTSHELSILTRSLNLL